MQHWLSNACGNSGDGPVPWPDTELTCPKCHGSIRSYERSGILIDQCSDCRGVFLDRGELEKLIDAEAARSAVPPARGSADAGPLAAGTPESLRDPYRGGRYDDRFYDRYDERGRGGYSDSRDDPRYRGKRKKKSFLEELFD